VTSPRPPDLRIIGVDCATQPRNVGLSLCSVQEGRPRLDEVSIGETWPAIDRQIAQWLKESTLVAVDAPLGWPLPLSQALGVHRAGDALPHSANRLFRRRTDDVIAEALGKRPLDVGADRIARTAHTALGLLARLGEACGWPISLAWEPGALRGVAAIEVYPAGTLASRGLPRSGYKGQSPAATVIRRQIVDALVEEMTLDSNAIAAMVRSDHALDAGLCALAGWDFVTARVMKPDDLELAKHEGWIWVSDVADSGSGA
jgi:hypothetical protein